MRGDVVVASLGNGRRPAVVVTRHSVIPLLSRVTVVPITRTRRGIPTEVDLDEQDGLRGACVASCDNVTTIPRAQVHGRIGTLGPERRRQLDDALRVALELD